MGHNLLLGMERLEAFACFLLKICKGKLQIPWLNLISTREGGRQLLALGHHLRLDYPCSQRASTSFCHLLLFQVLFRVSHEMSWLHNTSQHG